MQCKNWWLAAAGCAMLTLSTAAHGALLVNDRWADGTDTDPASPTYSENGADADADGDLESAWFRGGDGTLDPAAAGGPLRGKFSSATSASSASWTTYFTPEASKVNLANNGDQLKVTWAFTPQNVNATNGSQNFRIGLVNTPNGLRPAVDAAPSSGAYTGYALFLNFGQTTGRTTPFQLLERTAASGDLLGTGGNWGNAVNAPGFGNAAVGYANNTEYQLVMTLTRNGAALDIGATMTGGNINGTGSVAVSTSDASPSTFVFDTFAMRPSGATTTAEQFDTRLFRVEFSSVPEPATLSLCGFAALVGVAVARRK